MISLDHALKLVEGGIAAFPCLANKAPATPRGFHNATRDPAGLRQLWRLHPGPLIGIPTGAINGFDVLDIDAQHGGLIWWDAHLHEVPPTRIHRTRSGGLHIAFRHDASLRNSASKIGAGVDTRGDGGYIIWWPATGLDVLDDSPIAAWPPVLLSAYLTATAPPAPPAKAAPLKAGNATDTAHRAMTMIARSLYRLATASAGQRHYQLRAAACTIGGLLDTAGIGEAEAQRRLVDTVMQAGGEDRKNAEKTAAWGIARGRASPLQIGERR